MLGARKWRVARALALARASTTAPPWQSHATLRPIVRELIDALLVLLTQEKFDDVTLSLRALVDRFADDILGSAAPICEALLDTLDEIVSNASGVKGCSLSHKCKRYVEGVFSFRKQL